MVETGTKSRRASLVPFLLGLLTATALGAAGYLFVLPRLAPLAPTEVPHQPGNTAARAPGASTVGSLAPLVADEYSSLNIKAHTTELTTDKALRAADALRRGDYQAAESIAEEILKRSKLQAFSFQPLDRFITHLSSGNEPDYLDGLNLWLKNRPQSALAHLLRAKYLYDTAWLIRGEDFSSAVPPEHKEQFDENLGRAADDIRQSIKLDSNIPWSYYLRLQIAEVRDSAGDIEQVFLAATSRYPDYYPLYRVRLHYLEPKWGGSAAAMHQFVAKFAGSVPPASPRNLLYMQLAANLLDDAWIECRNLKHELLTACMDAYMNREVGGTMADRVTKALALYGFTDHVQFSNALWPILGEMVDAQGDNQAINSLLQLAAEAMGSNTELIQNEKHNNYVIDDVTARVWAKLDNSGNVEQKFREALDDVEHTPFASEDDKAVVLGDIYDHMAWVARGAGQYIKVIAYHDAANATGGMNRGGTQFNKCFAYYQLRHFQEAVDECTLVIDSHRGSLRAHVYRAWANEALKKYDAALAEYRYIADNGSENSLRTNGVINLDHVYSLLGKTDEELATFDRYPFVFNTDIQSQEDLAIVYNNRCYVYMKLGQPRKALDDCNTSLRYGRLPDALHKQQELQKLLAEHST
jgi:tetratricopeptide (TPR) repeat protein